MAKIRIIPTRATITIAIIIALILPVTYLILAYLFNTEVDIDKPKVVEELAKSIVTLIIALSSLLISNALSRNEIDAKAKALRNQIQMQLLALKTLFLDISHSPNILDKSLLEKSSVEVIRNNFQNAENFNLLIQNLSVEIEKVNQNITSKDPEIGIGCSDYVEKFYEIIITINYYSSKPSFDSSERIKFLVNELLSLIEK